MAIEYNPGRSINFESTKAVFKNGSPTNAKEYDGFIDIMKSINFETVQITEDFIDRVFNYLYDPVTGTRYSEPLDHFSMYCKQHGFQWSQNNQHRSVFVKKEKL